MYHLDGQDYTKEELRIMINYYKIHTQPKIIPQLVYDVFKEMMYYVDTSTLRSFCQTNKQLYTLYDDVHFWKTKFDKNNLPLICKDLKFTINTNDIDEQHMKFDDWKILYDDTSKAIKIATKLVDNLIKHKKCTLMHGHDIYFIFCHWLPKEWHEYYKNAKIRIKPIINYHVNSLNDTYIIDFSMDQFTNFIKLSKKEFILYITKLLYYFPYTNKNGFLIFFNKRHEYIIHRHQLTLKPNSNIKAIFPDW
jgi:hypothetical protein